MLVPRLLESAREQPTNSARDAQSVDTLFGIFARWMHQKKQANDVRMGNVVATAEGKLLRVTKCTYTQGAGRGQGTVQLEGKCIMTHTKHPLRYKTKDVVDVVRLEAKQYQFLYREST